MKDMGPEVLKDGVTEGGGVFDQQLEKGRVHHGRPQQGKSDWSER
jgi:hypothetical protein